ncbi:MAG TPA: hypothetical protein VF451_02790 [Acidobacteriota bacterium]
MPKRAIISSIVMMVMGFFPLAAQEHDPIVSSGTLVEKANAWDGRTVSFMGEAIGEAMRRGSMCWIHLNDDAYMWKNIEEGTMLGGYNSGQAIWIPSDLAAGIRFFGDYLHDGDIVKISGVFHSACREHGGDMDIHAVRLEIVRLGYPVPHKVNYRRLVQGLFMLSLTGLLFWMRVLARRKRI